MKNKINVIIVDDHIILRAGLKQVLSETGDIQVIAEAGTAHEAIQHCRLLDVDVLLLDISLPDRSGIEALTWIKKERPETAVLILSMHKEDQYAMHALKAGAAGYLCKQSAADELVNALYVVAAGKKYISPTVVDILAKQVTGEGEKALHERLSKREYQTLIMITSGLSVSQIAKKLSLSAKTVSMYRARLLEKMQIKHNAELTHYAIKHHLVE